MSKRRRQTLPALLLRPVDAVLARRRRRSSARPQTLGARVLGTVLVGFMGEERVSEDDLRRFFAAAFAICAIVLAFALGSPHAAAIDRCDMPGNGNEKKCTPPPPPPETTTPPPPASTTPPPPDPTPSEEPTPEETPTEEPTPSEEPTPEETPTEEPTPIEEPTPEPTPSEEPTPEPTPSEEPSPTPEPTPEPDPTPSELPPDNEPPWPPPTEEPPPPPPSEEPPPPSEEPPPSSEPPPPPPPETTEPPPPPPPETTEPPPPPPPDDPGPTDAPPPEEPPDDGAVPPTKPDGPGPTQQPQTLVEGSDDALRTPRTAPEDSSSEIVWPGAPEAGGQGSGGGASAGPRQINEPGGLSWSLGRLLDSAGTAAKRLAFPLTLIVIVVLFLLVQGELDRRDPKLAKAAINSELDLVMFQ